MNKDNRPICPECTGYLELADTNELVCRICGYESKVPPSYIRTYDERITKGFVKSPTYHATHLHLRARSTRERATETN